MPEMKQVVRCVFKRGQTDKYEDGIAIISERGVELIVADDCTPLTGNPWTVECLWNYGTMAIRFPR